MALPTLENTLFALVPMSRTVPTTITRITASMTAYSAISCPLSSFHRLCNIFATGSVSWKNLLFIHVVSFDSTTCQIIRIFPRAI